MRRAVWLACLLWGVASLASAATKRYTLIVAENKSLDSSIPALRFADDDGAAYYELFQQMSESVTLLAVLDAETQRQYRGLSAKTQPPTLANLRAALSKLNATMEADQKRGDTPIFYFIYAGHGSRAEGGEGYVNLADVRFLRSDLFREVVGPSTASFNHIIVDACDSYFLVKSRGDKTPVWKDDTSANDHSQEVAQFLAAEDLSSYPNTGVILSTSSAEETHEWELYRKGIFSHELRSALTGAADVNADGRVEYSELKAFIAAANTAIDDPKARLSIFAAAPPSEMSIALVDLPKAKFQHYLLVPKTVSGHLYLEDDRGVRYADFHADGARAVVLALVPSSYYFLRSKSQENKISLLSSGVHKVEGSWKALSVASRGAVEEGFRQKLFETPYGPDFYQGYIASSGDLPVSLQVKSWVPLATQEEPREPLFQTLPPKVLVSAGASLTAGVGALTFGVLAANNFRQFQTTLEQTGIADAGLQEKIERQLLIRNLSLGAAVAAAGVGVLLYMPARKEAKKASLSIGPQGGGPGLYVVATF